MHKRPQTSAASLHVDLSKIEANARALTTALPGVAFVGVTKSACGSPEVARALLAGGVRGLGDSRLENLSRLVEADVARPLWLLRAPTPDSAAQVVHLADVSLNSEIETVRALSIATLDRGHPHGIVAMVDLGDLREGILPADLPAFLSAAIRLDGIRIVGIGTNLTCYGGVVPTHENLSRLVQLTEAAEAQLGRPLVISGGNSSTLWRALRGGGIPERIDNLRVGESILLGVDTVTREPIEGLHRDAFVLSAPVIECLVKPSLPFGEMGQDAFGNKPKFVDRGLRRRAIVALGRQDAPPEGLTPCDRRIEVLGASSDHLILDVDALEPPPVIGAAIDFLPNYAALLQAFTSDYVYKDFTPPA